MYIDEREPLKGIFWFICFFNEKDECDFSETEILALTAPWGMDGDVTSKWNFNSRKRNSFNHKAAWESLVKHRKDIRKYGWNYFPRGRVEIAGRKALIYININIVRYDKFLHDIVEIFHLAGFDIRVIVDNSTHYYCHGDDSSIE